MRPVGGRLMHGHAREASRADRDEFGVKLEKRQIRAGRRAPGSHSVRRPVPGPNSTTAAALRAKPSSSWRAQDSATRARAPTPAAGSSKDGGANKLARSFMHQCFSRNWSSETTSASLAPRGVFLGFDIVCHLRVVLFVRHPRRGFRSAGRIRPKGQRRCAPRRRESPSVPAVAEFQRDAEHLVRIDLQVRRTSAA